MHSLPPYKQLPKKSVKGEVMKVRAGCLGQALHIGSVVTMALVLAFCTVSVSAAVVEWQVGPINVSQERPAELIIANLEKFTCKIAVATFMAKFERPPGVPIVEFRPATGTDRDFTVLRPGQAFISGGSAPAGEGEIFIARVIADCPNATVTEARRLSVTVQIVDPRNELRPQAALLGVVEAR